MSEKTFLFGLMLGMVGGALIVANSQQARRVVKESQEQLRKKADNLTKRKCCNCEENED